MIGSEDQGTQEFEIGAVTHLMVVDSGSSTNVVTQLKRSAVHIDGEKHAQNDSLRYEAYGSNLLLRFSKVFEAEIRNLYTSSRGRGTN